MDVRVRVHAKQGSTEWIGLGRLVMFLKLMSATYSRSTSTCHMVLFYASNPGDGVGGIGELWCRGRGTAWSCHAIRHHHYSTCIVERPYRSASGFRMQPYMVLTQVTRAGADTSDACCNKDTVVGRTLSY